MQHGVAEFAVQGEQGLDIFRRVDDRNQRRYRYECIATVTAPDTQLVAYAERAETYPERMFEAAQRFSAIQELHSPFALGVPDQYPRADSMGAALDLFLYLDFFRLWQIAQQEIARMTTVAQSDRPAAVPEIASVLRLALDFNRLRAARALIDGFKPQLLDVAATGKDDRWQNAGYALRMVGDLQMRLGDPVAALAAYDGAIALGDNRHRRGLAIKAAYAAGLQQESVMHLQAYQRKWPLPDRLDAIRASLAPQTSGDPA